MELKGGDLQLRQICRIVDLAEVLKILFRRHCIILENSKYNAFIAANTTN